jgi:hypothetical protein
MSQSKHSLRIVPITRSQIEFAVGLHGGLFRTRSCSRWMDSSSLAEKMRGLRRIEPNFAQAPGYHQAGRSTSCFFT